MYLKENETKIHVLNLSSNTTVGKATGRVHKCAVTQAKPCLPKVKKTGKYNTDFLGNKFAISQLHHCYPGSSCL